MKKALTLIFMLVNTCCSFAQSPDYRTTEDGINKLLSNPDFIQDVINMGTEEFTLEKLDEYFEKYVPEYSNYRVNTAIIDFNNIYYANTANVSTDALADKLSAVLKLNPAQSQHMKNMFTGNLNYTATNSYSTGLGNSLYDRGKNAQVDYAVDYAVDFFQGEFGDGGVNSALIDIGGGVLGAIGLELDRIQREKEAAEAVRLKIIEDYTVFTQGGNYSYNPSTKSSTQSHEPHQKDLYIHSQANDKVPGSIGFIAKQIDYEGAIKLYTDAINLYKRNPDRAYYLYMAYVGRARSKMQKGGYRAAIIDYYFAEGVLNNILTGKLADKSVKYIYPVGYFDLQNKATLNKGKIETQIGSLTYTDFVILSINRAYAKYRAGNYSGAIADCKAVSNMINSKGINGNGTNGYKGINAAIIAMSLYGLNDFAQAYAVFSTASLNDELIADMDGDGIADFTDMDKKGRFGILDNFEDIKTILYYGLPDYFPFDVVQIKGLVYYKAGKIDEAIAIYEKISSAEGDKYWYGSGGKKMFTKSGGDISSVYSTLSSFYYESANHGKAIALLDEAINLDPTHSEYYTKRAAYKKLTGDINGAADDAKKVGDPNAAATATKSVDYYQTKYISLNSAGNNAGALTLLKEALKTYPDNEAFFSYMVKCLQTENSAVIAQEVAEAVKENKRVYHVAKFLQYDLAGDDQKQEVEISLAFDNGLEFYTANTIYGLKLKEKPYYCKLFTKYGSKTNNNFITKGTDFVALEKQLDSIWTSEIEKYKNVKGVKGILEDQKKEQIAKSLGKIEEYLRLLDGKMMYNTLWAIDKIECLFILGRGEEAIKFAQRIKSKMIQVDVPLANEANKAVQNVANGGCN